MVINKGLSILHTKPGILDACFIYLASDPNWVMWYASAGGWG